LQNIRNLDLNLLKALDALIDERSVTRAAERLGFTQPAVSGMLTRLRESFDDPLFVRTQRGIVPTLRASELAGPVKQILSEVESLLRPQGFDPPSASFTITIAATDYALRAAVLPLLSLLKKRAPNIKVSLVPVNESVLQGQMESGEIDLALVTPETAPPDFHARRLFEETYVCAMRKDHPAAQLGVLTLETFCALNHALASYSGRVFRGVADEALAALGRERQVTLATKSFLLLPEILLNTDMIAVMPRRTVQGVEGLALMEPPLDVPGFTKLAVWHERTHCDAGNRWVRALLFEASGHIDGTHPGRPADGQRMSERQLAPRS